MGYYSAVSGVLTPKETISQEKFDTLGIKSQSHYEQEGVLDISYWIDGFTEDQTIQFGNYGKARNLDEEIVKLLSVAKEAGLLYSGYIERTGEDNGDMARYEIANSEITARQVAQFKWVNVDKF